MCSPIQAFQTNHNILIFPYLIYIVIYFQKMYKEKSRIKQLNALCTLYNTNNTCILMKTIHQTKNRYVFDQTNYNLQDRTAKGGISKNMVYRLHFQFMCKRLKVKKVMGLDKSFRCFDEFCDCAHHDVIVCLIIVFQSPVFGLIRGLVLPLRQTGNH